MYFACIYSSFCVTPFLMYFCVYGALHSFFCLPSSPLHVTLTSDFCFPIRLSLRPSRHDVVKPLTCLPITSVLTWDLNPIIYLLTHSILRKFYVDTIKQISEDVWLRSSSGLSNIRLSSFFVRESTSRLTELGEVCGVKTTWIKQSKKQNIMNRRSTYLSNCCEVIYTNFRCAIFKF